MVSKRTTLNLLTGTALAAITTRATAQSDRAVKFILPNATGSGVDAITRAAAPGLSKALGHNVVVENQPGASGILGLQALARSAPDGFTLSVVSNNVVIFPSVMKSLPFDMPGDFTPISIVGCTPMVLVVNPQKLAVNNSRELIAALKAKPNGYTFGSGGNGTILHLAAEMFIDEALVQVRHVPYKGVGPMVTDLLGGHIDFAVAATPSVLQHVRAGTLRAIGMCGDKRSNTLPDVPTFIEQGLTGYNMEAWFAVIGPKGLPRDQVKRVHDAVSAAFNDASVKEQMSRQGNFISVSTPEQAQAAFRSELAKYAALVKKAGIQAE
jgi:tripartite-type tricarboxylate transporter receptor subunit TctC